MLRRLHHDQPENFTFTKKNLTWAKEQIKKYPEGREASAIIPLLWRAQEQEGWLTRPAIEYVSDLLNMAYIRALEVASFYFMFQLQPVGEVAHIQVCGTTSCMISGAEDLAKVCEKLISKNQHEISKNGKFSWEEVECLGACSNAPMVQIGKDFYEDLNSENFEKILMQFEDGKVPKPGPQNGRYAAEPLSGLTTLSEYEADKMTFNASVNLAVELKDTIARIGAQEKLNKDGK
jgi:NADH-quinone oxidoreductase subunit E